MTDELKVSHWFKRLTAIEILSVTAIFICSASALAAAAGP